MPEKLNKLSKEKLPEDLRKAFTKSVKAQTAWESLTPIARRDFVAWIESAKQAETYNRRVERTCSMLINGKRRPCCYAVVPLDIYKELSKNPKAKAIWKTLSPTEKRDYVARKKKSTSSSQVAYRRGQGTQTNIQN